MILVFTLIISCFSMTALADNDNASDISVVSEEEELSRSYVFFTFWLTSTNPYNIYPTQSEFWVGYNYSGRTTYVKVVQAVMNLYYAANPFPGIGNLTVDGIYGDNTNAAVYQFKINMGHDGSFEQGAVKTTTWYDIASYYISIGSPALGI